jgi:hypothetical protein
MSLQDLPGNLIFEIIEEKTAVIKTGKLVFEDQTGGIFAHILEKGEKILISHIDPSSLIGANTFPQLDFIV